MDQNNILIYDEKKEANCEPDIDEDIIVYDLEQYRQNREATHIFLSAFKVMKKDFDIYPLYSSNIPFISKSKQELELTHSINDTLANIEEKITMINRNFDEKMNEIINRLEYFEDLLCNNNDEEEIIVIKDYTYDKARKIIEDHLKSVKRKVPLEEFILNFGIDLTLANQIITDLLKEKKVK